MSVAGIPVMFYSFPNKDATSYSTTREKYTLLIIQNQMCFAVRFVWTPGCYGVCGGFGDGHDP